MSGTGRRDETPRSNLGAGQSMRPLAIVLALSAVIAAQTAPTEVRPMASTAPEIAGVVKGERPSNFWQPISLEAKDQSPHLMGVCYSRRDPRFSGSTKTEGSRPT
jgi:hypothetical protein